MELVGLFLNFEDLAVRQRTPTGVLVVYPKIRQPVAVSKSPLSAGLLALYRGGVAYGARTSLGVLEERKANSADLGKFVETAAGYYLRGGLKLVQQPLLTLPEPMYLLPNMLLCLPEEASETVVLEAVKNE
jgi:hypothetical protein